MESIALRGALSNEGIIIGGGGEGNSHHIRNESGASSVVTAVSHGHANTTYTVQPQTTVQAVALPHLPPPPHPHVLSAEWAGTLIDQYSGDISFVYEVVWDGKNPS